MAKQTLHSLIEIMRHRSAEDDTEESVSEYALLVQLLSAGNALGGHICRSSQDAAINMHLE